MNKMRVKSLLRAALLPTPTMQRAEQYNRLLRQYDIRERGIEADSDR